MLIVSTGTGRAILKLASAQLRTSNRIGLSGTREISTAKSTHDRVPADLAELLPTLEELGLGSGDNVHVAMSGGVDSSVVLRLLANLPLNLHVVFMRNWDPLLSEQPKDDAEPLNLNYASSSTGQGHQCEWERDWADVQATTDHLRIPRERVRMVDFTKEYWTRVFEPAVGIWEGGGTPNPDVDCNREIKFGSLLDSIPKDNGGEKHFLATGHYARAYRDSKTAKLLRAKDPTKDQTYYLSQMTSDQLKRAVFPLANIPKKDVRRLAQHYNLPTAHRAESMGVCFIGERGRFGDFISQYTSPSTSGHLVTPSGERVGKNEGMWYYTIGQGAKLSGMKEKWFVARKGVGEEGKDVLVVPGSDHPLLQCTEIRTQPFHWISNTPPASAGKEMKVLIQVRHRMKPVPARITIEEDHSVVARLDDPITGVSPGQILAVYMGDECLGSAKIRDTVTLVTPLLLIRAITVSFFNPFRRAQKEEESGKIVVVVKWGREKYNIPIPSPSTTPLSQLRATLSAQTSIPITQLKLVHKGAVLKDYTLTLSSYGITDGSQLVMIGKEGDIPSAPPAPRPQVVKKKNKQPETDTESVLVDWIRSLVNSTLDPLQASIATFLSYTRVAKEGEQLNQPRQIPKFDILQKEHARLSELLLRGLLDLDGVEIPGEWQDARKERKEGVRRVQGELTKVDDAWTEKKKAEKAE